ncbi:DUF1366 domain-containing protein [Streptococcus ictaluri]|uniref:DUF1366 domain-containing protein n=2 Tax=Streptococcus ictaluri 707-05 TaxID=764299 RepID=G5K2D6_9STRE|nr:DUF1366 domain-containing protein [Streptococcus ictaluri]EHI70073.1 hypothetical protein STRIC_2545 [Streptococcus ictaluri 707-05]
MKTLQLSGKPYPIYEEGKITKTEVRLVGDGGLFIPVELIGDQTAKEADDLMDMALKAFVREYVTEYAVAESVQKVEILNEKVKEYDKQMAAMQAKGEQAIKDNQAKVDKAVVELTELVTSSLAGLTMPEVAGKE